LNKGFLKLKLVNVKALH